MSDDLDILEFTVLFEYLMLSEEFTHNQIINVVKLIICIYLFFTLDFRVQTKVFENSNLPEFLFKNLEFKI